MVIHGSRTATCLEPRIAPAPPWIECGSAPWPWPALPNATDGLRFAATQSDEFTLISAEIPDAAALSADTFADSVRTAYLRIHDTIGEHGAGAVRYWNYIPSIHDPMGPGQTRYMVFNAGRFAAMEQIHGGRFRAERRVATATGVGHQGRALRVHALALPGGGCSVENPRQVPAYRYSQRHGPVPPCFARATVVTVEGTRFTLVGGTAAVRGENSTHAGNLAAQLDETLNNLRELLDCARAGGAALRFLTLRAYVVRASDIPAVRAALAAGIPGGPPLDIVRADVCRPELLVEIEGVAEQRAPRTPSDP